jgi:hypothetical protein
MTVTPSYISGRKQYSRPQAMIWSDEAPTILDTKLIPIGYEVGSDLTGIDPIAAETQFLILSDHNRSAIDIKTQRIEQRKRMVNGTMRSYHIADKLNISTSWDMIPSRGFAVYPNFAQENTNILLTINDIEYPIARKAGEPSVLLPSEKDAVAPKTYYADKSQKYTVDGGAGGGEMLEWYENHTGPFWVMLSYDKYNNFGDTTAGRNRLSEYSQSLQMYISDFSYNVVKRGGTNFDLWNVSVTLEEV